MSISTGSRILISLNQDQQEYIVRHIDDRGIYISSDSNPNQLSLLIYINNEWRIYDEQLNGPSLTPYQIHFILDINYSSSVWSFGSNIWGQLGLGDKEERYAPTQILMDNQPLQAKQISTGEKHSLIIDLNDNVRSFGNNIRGQLGLSDNKLREIPTQIFIHDQPLRAMRISTGENHSLIIDINNNVWAFGDNNWGQLGLGDNLDKNIPIRVFINDHPIKAIQISTGKNHSLIIGLNNNVWAFGNNYSGQLGLGDNQDRNIPTKIIMNDQPLQAKQISAGGDHTLVIDMDSNIWAFGDNNWGQLGLGDYLCRNIPTQLLMNGQPFKVKQISAGKYHSLIIDMDDNVWSFGGNDWGELGLGNKDHKNIPTQIFINNQPLQAKQISAGDDYSLIIDLNNNVWSFGNNDWGKLGLGDYSDKNIPTQIFVNDQSMKAKQVSAGGHSLIIGLK